MSVDRENYLGLIGERDDAERERDRLNQEVLNLEARLAQAERALEKADALAVVIDRMPDAMLTKDDPRYQWWLHEAVPARDAYRTARRGE